MAPGWGSPGGPGRGQGAESGQGGGTKITSRFVGDRGGRSSGKQVEQAVACGVHWRAPGTRKPTSVSRIHKPGVTR